MTAATFDQSILASWRSNCSAETASHSLALADLVRRAVRSSQVRIGQTRTHCSVASQSFELTLEVEKRSMKGTCQKSSTPPGAVSGSG